MNIEINAAPIASVAELRMVPITFTVDRVCDVEASAEGYLLRERAVETPYVKDYDGIPEERPDQWARHFDISNWGYIRAQSNPHLVGGAVVAFNTAGVTMLEGRRDLGVLWDIRVSPDVRGQGVGSGLLRAAEAWAISRGCRVLKVETQNVNLPACRFYQSQGFTLRTVNRSAYPAFPDEIQLLWYKDLTD